MLGESGSYESEYDVVCVGGGIAGSGLAAVLAKAGKRCLVLEATEEFPDRTKGEWIAPWGVIDATQVGLLDVVRSARGHSILRHATHDETQVGDDAEMLDFRDFAPFPPPLTQRHPDLCQALFDHASAVGAATVRPVASVSVSIPDRVGERRTVAFTSDGVEHAVTARLVVAADGRNSSVRRQLGLKLARDKPHHNFSGLLIDGAHDWPADLQVIGTDEDVHFLAFPQGEGRVRLYLGWDIEDRHRFTGPEGGRRFADRFAGIGCVPGIDAFQGVSVESPCSTYSNEDAWLATPVHDGVVFMGDAAGWNDPIIGQGLAITFRDIRVLSELLLAADDWDERILAPYVVERQERMRRLRFSAAFTSVLRNEFGPAAAARRRRVRTLLASRPDLAMTSAVAFVGPDVAPSEAFTPERWAELVGV